MILVSGSLAYDRIMNFPGYFRDHLLPEKLHVLSVSFLIDRLDQYYGGTAGNIAYNLALLGEHPTILAAAGSDFLSYRQWLKRQGIDISYIQEHKNIETASAHIVTDKADNQITAFHPGAMSHPIRHNIQHITKLLRVYLRSYPRQSASIAIVSPGNLDDMRRLPEVYKKHGVSYIYDPGQMIPALSKRDLVDGMTGAKALIVNDYELALVQKKTGFTTKNILGRVEILATTLGEKGSVIETQVLGGSTSKRRSNLRLLIPAVKPKKVVDPTGAGDAYRAGFIYGLLREWPLPKVGRFAATLAIYTVEKQGTQTHRCTWADLRRQYKNNFGEKI